METTKSRSFVTGGWSKILLLLGALLVAGCTTPLQVTLSAGKHLNPDVANRSLPVQVVIYQLRDDQAFRQATFTELWQNDKEVLRESLLSRRELSIAPGSKTHITLNHNKEATYIGAIAIFRHPQNGHWRGYKRIGRGVPLTKKQIQINLQGTRLGLR